MAEPKRVKTLELEEDLRFQAREWRVSRILWFVLLAIIVATALGVFGSGVLSRTRAGAADAPLSVEYDRVARFGASVRLIVHARAQRDGSVEFTIGRSLLNAFRVQHVTPAPASASIVADGIAYRFEAMMSEMAPVIFEMQPATRWIVQGQIRSADGSVQLRQIVLP